MVHIVEQGKKAGFQHFLLFLPCFQKVSFSGLFKTPDCVVKSLECLEFW